MGRKKVTALKTWQYQDPVHGKSQATTHTMKNPSDVEFLNDSDFIVCDSDLHCLHLFRKREDKIMTSEAVSDEINEEEEDEINDDEAENDDISITKKNSSSEKSKKTGSGNLKESLMEGSSICADGCYEHSVLLQGQMWPSCLVITKDAKVRLSDRKNKSVKTFDIERQEMLSEWSDIEEGGMVPHGLAITSKGESIVTDAKNNVVWVLSDQGEHLRWFGSEGDLLDQFRLPFYACVDSKDNILVSDNMNYCVKTFDSLGNFLIRIGSGHLFGQRKFQSPYGLTYDFCNNEILVADNDTNRIFTYDDQGGFMRYAVTGSECESPCGLSIKNDQLVVTLSRPDHCHVKLFKLQTIT